MRRTGKAARPPPGPTASAQRAEQAAAAPSTPRPETGRRREAGLLACRVSAIARLPEASPQWHIERSLAGHSCGGSRGFEPRSLSNPLAGNLARPKQHQYSELTLHRASGYDRARPHGTEQGSHDNHRTARITLRIPAEGPHPRRSADVAPRTRICFSSWLRTAVSRA
jgi:hypothetical protein